MGGDVPMVIVVVPKEVEIVDLARRLLYYHGNRVLDVGRDVLMVIVVVPKEVVTLETVDLLSIVFLLGLLGW